MLPGTAGPCTALPGRAGAAADRRPVADPPPRRADLEAVRRRRRAAPAVAPAVVHRAGGRCGQVAGGRAHRSAGSRPRARTGLRGELASLPPARPGSAPRARPAARSAGVGTRWEGPLAARSSPEASGPAGQVASEGDVTRGEPGPHRPGSRDPVVDQRLPVRRPRRGAERGVRRVPELAVDQRPVPVPRGEPEADVALPDVPQRVAPDRPVVVHLPDPVLEHPAGVEPAQAVRHGRGVRRGVPVHDARLRRPDRPAVLPVRVQPDGHREVVAEGLADGAGVEAGPEPGHLRVVHRVAVLVHDHLGVLCVVDAALAEPDVVVLVPGVAVVDAVLVDPHVLALGVDRPERRAEAERLEVLLGLVDPEVDHHLLEPFVVTSVEEGVRRAVRLRAGAAADVDPPAVEPSRAVEVAQLHGRVRRERDCARGVLLVGERLDPGRLHGIHLEDAAGADLAAARCLLRRSRPGHRHRRQAAGHCSEQRDNLAQGGHGTSSDRSSAPVDASGEPMRLLGKLEEHDPDRGPTRINRHGLPRSGACERPPDGRGPPRNASGTACCPIVRRSGRHSAAAPPIGESHDRDPRRARAGVRRTPRHRTRRTRRPWAERPGDGRPRGAGGGHLGVRRGRPGGVPVGPSHPRAHREPVPPGRSGARDQPTPSGAPLGRRLLTRRARHARRRVRPGPLRGPRRTRARLLPGEPAGGAGGAVRRDPAAREPLHEHAVPPGREPALAPSGDGGRRQRHDDGADGPRARGQRVSPGPDGDQQRARGHRHRSGVTVMPIEHTCESGAMALP
ncbi:MAG: hypothetical protein AVDCRST_MAG36-2937 [uncultured Nocardioidaceae bacterium]|uniref:Uncharacterized protein n=1 Tax=uncultured Nocardioidaceae bacterium TaxID=253824 RepID=A0A6J4MQQ0_9ACTN|nr:MAG: hypothetical protein AVDCRST_MAG36-2937 [uncultured Nocardioidaceae bacterium]